MTKQQIKDYEKVQPVEILKMWTEWTPEYKGWTLEALPLECAISDIDSLLDNTMTELNDIFPEGDYYKELKATARKARTFLKKYNK